MTMTICLLARKGGTGRTTLVSSLAGEFAKRGARVLCIDLDGQASLSRCFLGSEQVEKLKPDTTVAAVIANYGADVHELIHKTAVKEISLVPACDALEQLATPGVGDYEMAIADFIRDTGKTFDVVLIDTPPNTNVATTWAGLVASQYVISPVPADAFGTQSIISVQRIVEQATTVNSTISILGYVLNQVQRNGLNDAYVQTVRQLHGSQVFTTELPLAVAFREAMAVRMPLAQYKPRVKATKLIAELADEIDERITATDVRRAA